MTQNHWTENSEVIFLPQYLGVKLEDVKYAAFALSGNTYVKIESAPDKQVKITFTPRDGEIPPGLSGLFHSTLEDESLRSRVADNNRCVIEHVIELGLKDDGQPNGIPEDNLNAEQQKELERLIAEVEAEIKKESESSDDPLGVLKTWEEVHGHGRTDGHDQE